MSTYEQVKGQVPEIVKSLVKRARREEGQSRVVRCRRSTRRSNQSAGKPLTSHRSICGPVSGFVKLRSEPDNRGRKTWSLQVRSLKGTAFRPSMKAAK